MKKLTVNDAIIKILKEEGQPLTASALYRKIVEKDLYSFNSANPEHIVRTQLRRHSENVETKTNGKKLYRAFPEGTYTILKNI